MQCCVIMSERSNQLHYIHTESQREDTHTARALSLSLSLFLVLLEAAHPALIRLYREFEFRSSSSHRTEPADSFHADPARAHCRCVNTFAASFHRDSQRKYISDTRIIPADRTGSAGLDPWTAGNRRISNTSGC